jgi:hypothetical protein
MWFIISLLFFTEKNDYVIYVYKFAKSEKGFVYKKKKNWK